MENVIMIKYFDENLPKVKKLENGDCIDLRACEVCKMNTSKLPLKAEGTLVEYSDFGPDKVFKYKKGDVLTIGLGIAMKLPKTYRCNMFPRSSTFKKYGFILVNSVGIIDNAYCGPDDEWKAMVYCMFDGELEYGDRLFQFEPVKVLTQEFSLVEVPDLVSKSRGGFGSTGRK